MIASGELSSRGGKDVLVLLVDKNESAKKIASESGLLQESDSDTLGSVVDEIIAEHVRVVADYKSGNDNALQFLIGQGMKKTKGSANPGLLAQLLKEKLS